jgi:hypothetical protein
MLLRVLPSRWEILPQAMAVEDAPLSSIKFAEALRQFCEEVRAADRNGQTKLGAETQSP